MSGMEMGMVKFFKEIFADSTGAFSSKRTVTLCAFFLIVIAVSCDLLWKRTLSEFMFDDLMYIVLTGLGFTAAEPVASSLFGNRVLKSGGGDDDGK